MNTPVPVPTQTDGGESGTVPSTGVGTSLPTSGAGLRKEDDVQDREANGNGDGGAGNGEGNAKMGNAREEYDVADDDDEDRWMDG